MASAKKNNKKIEEKLDENSPKTTVKKVDNKNLADKTQNIAKKTSKKIATDEKTVKKDSNKITETKKVNSEKNKSSKSNSNENNKNIKNESNKQNKPKNETKQDTTKQDEIKKDTNKTNKTNKKKTQNTTKKETKVVQAENLKEKDKKADKIEEKDTKELVVEEVALKDTNDNPDYIKDLIRKRKIKVAISITIIILLLFLILFSIIFSLLNMNKSTILDGITIKNINISELTNDEARQKLQDTLNKELIADLKLKYNDYETIINPSQIEFTYNIDEAIEEADKIGRDDNIVKNNYTILFTKLNGKNLDITYSYNQDLLNTFVENINSELPGVVVEPSYYMENNVLYVDKGVDGIQISSEDMKKIILQSFVERSFEEMIDDSYTQEIEIKVDNVKASKIDMSKIYSEIHTEPKDAYFETDPYKIYKEVDGIDLKVSVEDAQKEVDSQDKEEYSFDLKIIKASKTIDDLGTEAFPYLISSFSTKYDASNTNRSTNLQIAAQKINGKVLMPGEEFSFNTVVGKRTVEDGYKDAKIYADGGVVDGLAGGICQISSTLYNTVLLANLEVTERKNHSYPTSYVQVGKDATVVYGVKDFKFKNSRNYPIKIEATVKNGIVDFKMHGMSEEKEYEVRILPVTTSSIPFSTTYQQDATLAPGTQAVLQTGHPGYKVTTYKELRLNGTVISKEIISNDTYEPMRTIIRVGPTQ